MTDQPTVTIKVMAPAGRLIPGYGSFQVGETFQFPADQAEALLAASTGLERVEPPAPTRRASAPKPEQANKESED